VPYCKSFLFLGAQVIEANDFLALVEGIFVMEVGVEEIARIMGVRVEEIARIMGVEIVAGVEEIAEEMMEEMVEMGVEMRVAIVATSSNMWRMV
jgi:hypothetical protein